ncbi:MAG: hypothetical protein OXT65_02810 [Alphaproteobacteria bacterium]|nr:hypothetical protein [Alphaproteobacteria bacterium]
MGLIDNIKKSFQNPEKDRARLNRLEEIISSVPEGKELFDMALFSNCSIKFDYSLGLMDEGHIQIIDSTRRDGEGKYIGAEIRLNPFRSDAQTIKTLCHELRHLWQYKKMGNMQDHTKLDIPRELKMASVRAIEGDAHAFEQYMAKKITAKTGMKIPFTSGNGLTRALGKMMRVPFFLSHFSPREKNRGDVNRENLFWDFQKNLNAPDYDRAVIRREEANLPRGRLLEERNRHYATDAFNKVAADLRAMLGNDIAPATPGQTAEADNKRFMQRLVDQIPGKNKL